jgi:hypothetical protein
MAMNLQRRFDKVEYICFKTMSTGGMVLSVIGALALAAFGLAKLIQWLVQSW